MTKSVVTIVDSDGEQPQSAAAKVEGLTLPRCSSRGNVAKRLDTRIYWDSENMKVTNDPEAEPLVRRPYREGWNL
jgi:hypothetical protein